MDEFLNQIRNDHHNFDKGKLSNPLGYDPFTLFEKWYKEAFESTEKEPNAMVLSTVDLDLNPSSRILYLKELSSDGFVFFTNYKSRKGQDLDQNKRASLLFFWPTLERQLRIEGLIEKSSEQISDEYFASRPRNSQLGAWASSQSEILNEREELDNRLIELEKRFPNEVPRPPHWGGYILRANYFEFWKGRPSRLHDRIVFEQKENKWDLFRLNP